MSGRYYFCLDSCLHVDIVAVLHFRGKINVVFNFELRLDANYAHKATCRRSTSGVVVICADALFIVFFLGCRQAFRSGLWK